MSNWQPLDENLHGILNFFKEATDPANNSNSSTPERLEEFNQILPDFNNYLAYILTELHTHDVHIRSVAGLTLKNNIKDLKVSSVESLEYIKEKCLQHIGAEFVSKIINAVITMILSRHGIYSWPQAPIRLLDVLNDPNPNLVKSAMNNWRTICDDCKGLDDPIYENSPALSSLMIPRFIEVINNNTDNTDRLNAVVSVYQLMSIPSKFVEVYLDQIVDALRRTAGEKDIELQKAICHSFVTILEKFPHALFPQIGDFVAYMLHSTKSEDPELALEACEFWLIFAELEEHHDHLRPFLPDIIPVLLKSMVYSDTDLIILGGDEDDAHVADDEQDIRPQFHKANVVNNDLSNNQGVSDSNKNKSGLLDDDFDADDDDDDDDDDDEFDEFEDDEDFGEWSLRKCSAATLDVLCTSFEQEAIHILIPLLKSELESDDWLHRECGILALGAAAEGGMTEIAPYLPELVPYLLSNINHPKPLVRSITCWTLGRYCLWIVECARQSAEARQMFLDPLVHVLLQRILDGNKRVQEAACSSFSLLEEAACKDLVHYLPHILGTFSTAFNKYQHRNLLLLYDAVGTLADVVGDALNNAEYINVIMPPLIEKWQVIADDNSDLFPLLECLSSVTTALGKGFTQFAGPVYNRCVLLVSKILEECHLAANDPSMDMPDKDFMIVALDLLSGIVQALNTDSDPLVANTNPPVHVFLPICIQDEVSEVRQSAYALLGDLAISCFERIKMLLPSIMPLLLEQIIPDDEQVSVCNNATWAAGEIAIKWGPVGINDYIPVLLQRLLGLMSIPNLQRTLLENVAITIGRLGLVCPDKVSPCLNIIIKPWLATLSRIRDNDEKSSAFGGLCEMIKYNHNGAVDELPDLCEAITLYHQPPPDLANSFREILQGYKAGLPAAWAQVPEQFTAILHERQYI